MLLSDGCSEHSSFIKGKKKDFCLKKEQDHKKWIKPRIDHLIGGPHTNSLPPLTVLIFATSGQSFEIHLRQLVRVHAMPVKTGRHTRPFPSRH